jgi:hypothetical protein
MDNTINTATDTVTDTASERDVMEADAILRGVGEGTRKAWDREEEIALRAAVGIGKRIGLSSVKSAIGAAVKARHSGLAADLRAFARQEAFARAGVADPSLRPRR